MINWFRLFKRDVTEFHGAKVYSQVSSVLFVLCTDEMNGAGYTQYY